MTALTADQIDTAITVAHALGDQTQVDTLTAELRKLTQSDAERDYRDEAYEYLFQQYYDVDLTLRGATDRLLDKLIKDGFLDFDPAPKILRTLEELDRSRDYRDGDGDLTRFRDGEWQWQDSEGDWDLQSSVNGPFTDYGLAPAKSSYDNLSEVPAGIIVTVERPVGYVRKSFDGIFEYTARSNGTESGWIRASHFDDDNTEGPFTVVTSR